MKFIKTYRSPNFNLRKKNSEIKFLILHYTAILVDVDALKYLCNKSNKVSSHYLIDKTGFIFNLVDDKFRAWHAGKSYWRKKKDINSNSIGIELCNSGHHLNFENYTINQITSISKLLIYLKRKYSIKSENILGHSDISPYRKIDPGEKFPWLKLSKQNIVKLPKIISKKISNEIELKLKLVSKFSKKKRALYMLAKIGYDAKPSILCNKNFFILIKVYQMHYRFSNVSGYLDDNTYEIIKSHYNLLLTD